MLLIFVTIYTALLTMFLIYRLKVISHIDQIPVTDNVEGNSPMVSVIVPMRNEENNVRFSIEGLLSQKYPDFEIIAVNDLSTDNTLNILNEIASNHNNLKVVDGTPTPPGWIGKTHALWQGIRYATGDWLLFVDADTHTDPHTLTSVIKYVQENKVDMLSLYPFHLLETFWVRAILPLILASVCFHYPQRKINDPRSKKAVAVGGFILIKRSVYESTGGHMTLRDQILEDLELAKLVKKSGYRLHMMGGKKLIHVRWYKNFNEMWEGLTKNYFILIRRDIVGFLLLVLGHLAWGVVPVILFICSFLYLIFGQDLGPSAYIIFIESLVLIILALFNGIQATRLSSIPIYYSLTLPIGVLGYIALMISSAYKIISGAGVTWKGRVYRF